MTLYDCDYKDQVCNLYYQDKEKNCKQCSVYINGITSSIAIIKNISGLVGK